MEELTSKRLSKQNERLKRRIEIELGISSDETIQLANELIEVISKKKGLTYQEVYRALEISYLAVESQSVFVSVSPIDVHFEPPKKRQEI